MKVYLMGGAASTTGGMYRVYRGIKENLPVEFVDSPDDADVAHAHVALYESLPSRLPLVISSHGLLWDTDPWHNTGWLTNRVCLRSYQQADVVTAPSRFVADTIGRQTLIPVQVVHHGINPAEWVPGDSAGYVLWNKARQDPANDPTIVNQLAERLPRQRFVSTFGRAAPNVRLVGRVDPEQMLELVQGAAVYLDTPRESGGPCFGVLEAMSCGVPVLSWRWGGTAEVIKHGETGYLAEPGNLNDLVAGLDFCLKNRSRLGENARQDVLAHYRWEQVVGGYLKAYETAIKKQQAEVTVSVVLTCYNLGKFLPHSVGSILSQTFQDWELIIVDDASTDDSGAIANQWAEHDPRIRVVHNPTNYHVADSRNIGMLHARGRYLLPLDGDDALEPTALARMVAALDGDRSLQVVSGKLALFGEDDLTHGRMGEWPNNADFDLQIQGYNRLPYCALYRRRVWENIGGYRRRIRLGVEDADFWTRALSYGYTAKVLPEPQVLNYTLRENSLRLANPNGVSTWLSWFPWSRDTALIPAGATGEGPYHLYPADNPQVSFIVPVGPGHAHHLQACVDSIVAQTEQDWEIIVINDTGQRWFDGDTPLTPYVMGMPFVRFIDNSENHGVAFARNRGIQQARGTRLIFLDVDDIAQPTMLSALLRAHAVADGWVYGDWYAHRGDVIEHSHAEDWSVDRLKNKALGPITGLYWADQVREVGGFDETIPGWEDWDFHLSLLEQGICGTRVAHPLITYQMNLGQRREENFSRRDVLIQYIQKKHADLYKRDTRMACKRCGGKKTIVETVGVATVTKNTASTDQAILLLYTGSQGQTRTFRSPNYRGVNYRINNRKPFWVFKNDVDWFLQRADFKVYETSPAPAEPPAETAVLTTQTPTVGNLHPLTELGLPPEIEGRLAKEFSSIEQVILASPADLLSIKGIGESRLDLINEAVMKWTAG